MAVMRAAPLLFVAFLCGVRGCGSSSSNGGSGDHVIQAYWYCWDHGAPKPHHLGYQVSNDRLCSDAELKDAGS